MPYVLSKLANSQIYTKYTKGPNNINLVAKQVEIKGGADITDKNLVTPEGVITTVTDAELELLKENKVFQEHLDHNMVKYYAFKPNMDKELGSFEKDNSAPLTPEHYKKQGKKAPKVS